MLIEYCPPNHPVAQNRFLKSVMYTEFFWADGCTHQTQEGATMVCVEQIKFQILCLQIL